MSADERPVISPKKLIEVALPLDSINAAAAREKSIRHGHPSTLHLWWARRPLAAARAVIFSQLVNDPEDLWWHQNPGAVPNKQVRGHWTKARKRLFEIIEELVLWENTTNEEVLDRAREEIRKSWREVCDLNKNHPQAAEVFNPDKMPGLHDPFAGGGTIPLEAQRLGLEAYASDLNPVAVLINKAMIEIPPKFAGRPPVHPDARKDKKLFNKEWKGAEGLAEDVRRYGQWMQDEAEKRIGHLYPKVEITAEMAKERPDLKPLVGQKLIVIAWIWARAVKSPNPAFSEVDVPLASTFILSSKEGKEAYVHPVVGRHGYSLTVKVGKPPADAKVGTKAARGANFRCVLSGATIGDKYVKAESMAGRMGQTLMAIVAEGARGRIYLSPTEGHTATAHSATPAWKPEQTMNRDSRDLVSGRGYGFFTWADLFTPRQLVALTTFTDLVSEARESVRRDAIASGLPDDDASLDGRGNGALAYAEAVSVYLAFVNSKVADRNTTLTRWMHQRDSMHSTFSKQALPMNWDFVEVNAVGQQTGGFAESLRWTLEALEGTAATTCGFATQCDAAAFQPGSPPFLSTDPPYYDNIGYADLSDFFYVWLRRSLRQVFPGLLATIAVPKAEELVASPYRHGSKQKAEQFFLEGMTKAMRNLTAHTQPATPITIYYAFKQSDTETTEGTSSSGWETFLGAVLESGMAITGTWPMRTERAERSVSIGTNSLASSIILVCRPRSTDAGTVSRRQFVRLLNEALPDALAKMTGADEGGHSPVAPVDLSQAIIGPGMAIFSRYDAVLEADGTPMTVRTALQLINRFLAEDDFDGDTQFCLHWFEQHGWEKAKFGEADTLARAKGTSVDGVKAAGVIESGGGSVRLLKWKEYPADWNASLDARIPVWEALHQLIRAYSSKGDAGAGKVLKACAGKAEAARQLAYRLYTLCERKGWAEDARAYNEVVTGWSGIERAAGTGGEEQRELFNG
jgi:putative DNA methylase